MSLSQTSKIIAVFAMPGLERVAAPLFPYASRAEAVTTVAYLAARWATGSAERLDAELRNPTVWSMVRIAAESRGRLYPDRPPTFNKLHHLRRRIGDDMDAVLLEMWAEFTLVALELAQSVGLCNPDQVGDLLKPVRGNTLYADGTWFKPLSGVKVNSATGEVSGSRSKALGDTDGLSDEQLNRLQGPRVAEVQTTNKHGEQLLGVPFVLAGVRGDDPLQRVVLGARRFTNPLLDGDGGEPPAAIELLGRVIDAADGALAWCVYDMAFTGEHLDQLARRGVVGVAAMRAADSDKAHLEVAGEGPKRHNNDLRKTRLRTGGIKTVQHRVGDRWCEHALSGVDGSLRVHPIDRPAAVTDALCVPTKLWFEPDRRLGNKMMATFDVPCPSGQPIVATLELTGKIAGSSALMLNRVRPINEYLEVFATMHGWRQDVESLNSTIKAAPHLSGRATSLAQNQLELDVLGACLLINATCWDVHAAHLTTCAQDALRLAENRLLRSA